MAPRSTQRNRTATNSQSRRTGMSGSRISSGSNRVTTRGRMTTARPGSALSFGKSG